MIVIYSIKNMNVKSESSSVLNNVSLSTSPTNGGLMSVCMFTRDVIQAQDLTRFFMTMPHFICKLVYFLFIMGLY